MVLYSLGYEELKIAHSHSVKDIERMITKWNTQPLFYEFAQDMVT